MKKPKKKLFSYGGSTTKIDELGIQYCPCGGQLVTMGAWKCGGLIVRDRYELRCSICCIHYTSSGEEVELHQLGVLAKKEKDKLEVHLKVVKETLKKWK